MYKIAICDDLSIDIRTMSEIIQKKAKDESISEISYFEFNSGEELLKNIDRHFDVIFLDIQMKTMSGNETAVYLRKWDSEVIIVFYSGSQVPTPSMFKVQPYRYIIKQFSKEKIEREVKEVLEKMVSKQKKYYSSLHCGVRYNINYADILYVSLAKRGCEIWILSDAQAKYKCKKIYSDESIRNIYEVLNDKRFIFAHNSYFINLQHVIKSCRTEVQLKDGVNLTIARSKGEEFRERMLEYSAHKYDRKNMI